MLSRTLGRSPSGTGAGSAARPHGSPSGRLSRTRLLQPVLPRYPAPAAHLLAGFVRCRLSGVSDTRSKPSSQEDKINGHSKDAARRDEDHLVGFGFLTAAIWENRLDDRRIRYNTTFQRRYRDAEGNWRSTDSFGRADLLVLAKIADLAHTRIYELASADEAHPEGGADEEQA